MSGSIVRSIETACPSALGLRLKCPWRSTCVQTTTLFHDHSYFSIANSGSTVIHLFAHLYLFVAIELVRVLHRLLVFVIISIAMSSTIAIPTSRSPAGNCGQSTKACMSSSSSFSSSPQSPASAGPETPGSSHKLKTIHHRRPSLLSAFLPPECCRSLSANTYSSYRAPFPTC